MNRLAGWATVLLLFGLLALAAPVSGAPHVLLKSSPPTAKVTGPSLLAVNSSAKFVLSATGGPAQAANGTIVGNYTYNATIEGANITGGSVSPSVGTFTNKSVALTVVSPNNTGSYTLLVTIKSSHVGGNSTNATASAPFTVVTPYVISTTIDNPTWYKIQGAIVEVDLDGTTIADVTLPTIGANGSYDFAYNYTTLGLPSGDHTFMLSLHSTPGLLEFSNGQTEYSVTIYVNPPPPDYTLYLVAGIGLTAVAIFISLLVVGGRARRRSK